MGAALYSIPMDEEKLLLARIPLLAGSDKKALYLSYRATGFGVHEAAELAEVQIGTVNKWRKSDKDFKEFETTRLQELQHSVSLDVIRLEFMRNFRMVLKKDFQTIQKALFNMDEMSPAEWSYFRDIRKHYTPNDLLAIEKAIAPEKHQSKMTINLSWGNDRDQVLEGNYTEVESSDFLEIEAPDASS